ncbi:MAG TPA: hypothetical protein VF229_00455 [Burkholderiaceae bacterium]
MDGSPGGFAARRLLLAACAAILGLAAAGPSAPRTDDGGIAVITGAGTPVESLTREQVADIFLGRMPPGEHWRPIDSDDEEVREKFYRGVANISSNRARAVWARVVFSSRLAPPREMPAARASEAIREETFAIAYVREDQAPRDARVLLVLP